MPIVLQNTSGQRLPITRSDLRSIERTVRRRMSLPSGVAVTIAAVAPKDSAALNRTYRQRTDATNILTFDVADERTRERATDIIICPSVIRSEAAAQHVAFRQWFAEIVVHGLLHVAGMHHETTRKAERQERLTREIVRTALGA